MGHRRAAALIAAACMVLAAGACAGPRASRSRAASSAARPPTVRKVTATVHPRIASFGAYEVAVLPPTGNDVAPAMRAAFREGLYDGLLERGYSPLAPAYVDAAGAGVAQPGRTFPLRAHVTGVRRSPDGGFLVSGWAGLVSPRDDGTEDTLYVCEISDLAVRPTREYAGRDGGEETGRALASAVLQQLPSR